MLGFVFHLGSSPISCSAKRQSFLATSLTKTEYKALFEGSKEKSMCLHFLMLKLGFLNLNIKNIYLCLKPLMIYYTSSLSIMNFLQHYFKYDNSYSPKKQIIPQNTSNFHGNAPLPLPLLTWQNIFCLGRSLSNYVVLVIKSMFKYLKNTIVDNHIILEGIFKILSLLSFHNH
jgi:hypothetical protein